MKTEKQDDTIVSALISWLNKHAADEKNSTRLKKDEINKSLMTLAESLQIVIEDVHKLTHTVKDIIQLVNQHTALIEELYLNQSKILAALKDNSISSKFDSEKGKKNSDKPN